MFIISNRGLPWPFLSDVQCSQSLANWNRTISPLYTWMVFCAGDEFHSEMPSSIVLPYHCARSPPDGPMTYSSQDNVRPSSRKKYRLSCGKCFHPKVSLLIVNCSGLNFLLYERDWLSRWPAPQHASISFQWPLSILTAFQACPVGFRGGGGWPSLTCANPNPFP